MIHFDYMDEIHKKEYQELEEKDYFRKDTRKAITVKGGRILPYRKEAGEEHAAGGVIDAAGVYIEESAQHIVGTEMNHGYEVKNPEKKPMRVMYFGAYHKHWGHFLTEMVSRCWYLTWHQPEQEDFYVAYSMKNDTTNEPMSGSFREFLTILGVSEERLILVTEPTEFQEVILPEKSCEAGQWYTREYCQIFSYLAEQVGIPEKVYEKLYLTRLKSRALSQTQIGERTIMKEFKKNGYKVVAPEQFSLTEQIRMLASCKKLVVVEGTLMHNLLFCKESIDITIINRVVGTNAYQPLIHQAKSAEVSYVDAHLSFFPVFAGGPFLFYFSGHLESYMKDKGLVCKGKREGSFRLHLKLIWYFLCYLENMSAETIDRWKLGEKHSTGVLEQYRFYRMKLKQYNEDYSRKMRKAFSLGMKGIFRL